MYINYSTILDRYSNKLKQLLYNTILSINNDISSVSRHCRVCRVSRLSSSIKVLSTVIVCMSVSGAESADS